MKSLNTFGLAALAAMALMAVAGAGTASATEICRTNSFPCPTESEITYLELNKDFGTSPVFETTEGSIQDTCTFARMSSPVSQGGASSTVVGWPVALEFTGCTKETSVNNLATCELEFHGISGSSNATVTAKGCTVTVNLGVNCHYGAGFGITLGEFVGGTTKTIAINTVLNGIDSNSFLCPTTLRWTAWYVASNVSAVYFHA